MYPDYAIRLRQLRALLTHHRVDGFVTSFPPHLFYLCGFTGSSGVLFIGPKAAILFTDGRYAAQAPQEVKGAQVEIRPGSLLLAAANDIGRKKGVRIGFESGRLSVKQLNLLVSNTKGRVRWRGLDGLVESLRASKDEFELDAMRDAARIGSEVFEEVVSLIRPGISERDLAAEIDYRMRKKGAAGPAFETIVASGARAAFPHARPTDKTLRKNELVVLDLGVILRHYCSDLSRTVFLGKAPVRIRRWYRAVKEAQEAARAVLAVNASADSVDAAARSVLRGYRLDRYFLHSTGHGLGLEVHEDPRLGREERSTIVSGAVVTLEPGVYVEGVGGIRIEDDVAIHPHGTEMLTSATRELLEL